MNLADTHSVLTAIFPGELGLAGWGTGSYSDTPYSDSS